MAGGQVISVRFDFECRSAGSSRQNPMKKNWRGLIVVRKYFQKIRARTQLWLWSKALFRSFRLNRRFFPLSSWYQAMGFGAQFGGVAWGMACHVPWWGALPRGLPPPGADSLPCTAHLQWEFTQDVARPTSRFVANLWGVEWLLLPLSNLVCLLSFPWIPYPAATVGF